jgi:uncharacterized protein YraI
MSLRSTFAAPFLLAAALVATSLPAAAVFDCEGTVVGVRPISQYNHANGNGFLAVRTGPGGGYAQIGEVYRGDTLSVYGKSGNWYEASCMFGRCQNPLWGPPYPAGWVHKNYVKVRGYCPR